MSDEFSSLLLDLSSEYSMPIIIVADTMLIMKAWFDDESVEYTAHDLIEAVKLVQATDADK